MCSCPIDVMDVVFPKIYEVLYFMIKASILSKYQYSRHPTFSKISNEKKCFSSVRVVCFSQLEVSVCIFFIKQKWLCYL